MVTVQVVKSNRGSVRFAEGSFYTSAWEAVFTPLDAKEAKRYLDTINEVEAEKGRWLTILEVLDITDDFTRGK